ncbi:MAG: DUF4276 family protein [Planctomycetota bacterium]
MGAHLEILVEEPSMEAFLREVLAKLVPEEASFDVHQFQCKQQLLNKLPARLAGYAPWLPLDWRILVLVDRDQDDCHQLKQQLEAAAARKGLRTRSQDAVNWQVVNRIAIEELEAWFFGDMDAVRSAYPRVPSTLEQRRGYRDPDAIQGGTWEAFERILQRAGYFSEGLPKIQVAREIGRHVDPQRNRSHSFGVFRDVILELVNS